MLDFLKGKVVYVDKDFVGLDVHDFGFRIYTSNVNNYQIDSCYTFYVSEVLKDEEIVVFGFSTHKELKLFQKIINVNGVGVKTALALLNNFTVEQLIYLIKSKNSKDLVVVPGVGTRADRIILELYNKLNDIDDGKIFRYENVFKALKQIGYKPIEISSALEKIPNDLTDNEATKLVIREINNAK